MTNKEIEEMVAAEGEHLGVGSKEFLDRHGEIMEMIDKAKEGRGHDEAD